MFPLIRESIYFTYAKDYYINRGTIPIINRMDKVMLL